jgi:hypothetical protein
MVWPMRRFAASVTALLVAQFVGQAQDPRLRKDIAVLAEAAVMMGRGRHRHVPVLVHATRLLRQVEHVGEVVAGGNEVLAPGDPIADRKRVAAQVRLRTGPDGHDVADDLVTEHARTRIRPQALVRVDVGPADRGHPNPYEHLAVRRCGQGERFDAEGGVRRVVDREAAFTGQAHGVTSVPLTAKSKI